MVYYLRYLSGCSAVGSVPASGAGGHGFKSRHSDHLKVQHLCCTFCFYIAYNEVVDILSSIQEAPSGNAKWSVITKGPLSKSFMDSAGTGAWAPEFKKAGFDALVIEGKAAKPTWIYINDDEVEFKDASDLWGLDSIETSAKIKEILGDKRINALNIGTAGEILNPTANITCDGHSFAGRGGAGAVMGSNPVTRTI